MTFSEDLNEAIKSYVVKLAADFNDGHTLRIDDMPESLVSSCVDAVRKATTDVYVFEMSDAKPQSDLSINSDKAVEFRNRIAVEGFQDSDWKLLIFVTPGSEVANPELNAAESSTGNSFEQVHFSTIIAECVKSFEEELGKVGYGPAIRQIKAAFPVLVDSQSLAEFLAEIAGKDSLGFGRALWKVGLISDLGEDPQSRLGQNIAAVKAISFPPVAGLTLRQRLQNAGVRADEISIRIENFIADGRALDKPSAWSRRILDSHPHDLTFEKWPLKEQAASDIESVTLVPFRKPSGQVEKFCKLILTDDEELICRVDPEAGGKVVVHWSTKPMKTDSIARWHFEIIPPADLRHEDSGAISSHSVKGSSRSASISIQVGDEELANGTKFVVRMAATDIDDQPVSLAGGQVLAVESEEFDVILADEHAPQDIRTATSATLSEAVLRAVEEGLDRVEHNLGSWDPKTQTFTIKLSPGRQTQILLPALSARLQRHVQVMSSGKGAYFLNARRFTGTFDEDNFTEISFDLPDALSKKRRDFLDALAAQSPRNYIEVADWTKELKQLADEYVNTYRRTLDGTDDPELRRQLLQLDTFTINMMHAGESFTATFLLPTHPVRVAWFKSHAELLGGWSEALLQLPKSRRKNQVDMRLVARLAPSNLPFVILNANAESVMYFDELSVGTGVYFPVGSVDLEMKYRATLGALGLERSTFSGQSAVTQLADRFKFYMDSHGVNNELSVLAVNVGEGQVLSNTLRRLFMVSQGDDLKWQGRVSVTTYSPHASFSKPVADLQALQGEIKLARTNSASLPFRPLLGLTSRDMNAVLMDSDPVHIAVVHGLIDTEIAGALNRIERASSLRGVIAPMAMTATINDDLTEVVSYPSLQIRGTQANDIITSTHRSHQSALAAVLGLGDIPGVVSRIDPNALAQLSTIHARADWVISIDRHLGASIFDLNFVTTEGRPYLLDYAPDFIDGIGDRLTITTSKRREVDRLLKRAMNDMDLYGDNHEPEDILDALSRLSGRLALRLTTNTTQAIEAVGLAVLMMHLEDRAELTDTIVIPLDSHPEIFGQSLDDSRTQGLRCDIMLVRVTSRSFRIELIEVKNRGRGVVPRILCDQVGNQLRETENVLRERYFNTEETRLDRELQWAKLSSLLHFYADRAYHLGQIDGVRIQELHRQLDRLEETRQAPEITKRGYVISLSGVEGFPEFSGDIPIAVLTQQELGQIGMTTLLAARDRQRGTFESGVPKQVEPLLNEPVHLPVKDKEITGGEPSEAIASPDAIDTDCDVPPTAIDDSDATNEDDSDGDADGGTKPKPTPERPAPTANLETSGTPGSVTIKLGHDAGSNVATWRISTEGSPHAFILGIPGQGKSVTTRRIMRDLAEQNLPTLVFDFHGDMAAAPPEEMQVFDASKGLPFSPFELLQGKHYAHAAYEIREILAIVGSLGEIQGDTVYRALLKCYEASGFTKEADGTRLPTIAEFVEMLEIEEEIAKSKNARARLTPLTDFDLFDEHSDESFEIREGKGMVIDLSQLGIEAVQMAAGSFILRKIYKEMFAWNQDHTMKLAIVLDEAHRLAKDVTLPKIMKEGRKYGIAVIVASQGLEDFSPQVISNAGTKIAFRCNFPSSRKVGGLMRGPKNVELSEKIENLQVGQAYVSTPEHTEAQKIYMFGDDD
jgi:hypothetical protein